MFSFCPELHKQDLEIWAMGEADDGKRDKPSFHFSEANDGDYGFFYLFNTKNHHNRCMTAISGRRASIADHSKASVD